MNRREKAIARLLGKYGPLTAVELHERSPHRWFRHLIRYPEPALSEMVARGVLEAVASKGRQTVYLLTDIGRRAYLDE